MELTKEQKIKVLDRMIQDFKTDEPGIEFVCHHARDIMSKLYNITLDKVKEAFPELYKFIDEIGNKLSLTYTTAWDFHKILEIAKQYDNKNKTINMWKRKQLKKFRKQFTKYLIDSDELEIGDMMRILVGPYTGDIVVKSYVGMISLTNFHRTWVQTPYSVKGEKLNKGEIITLTQK